MPSSRPNTIPTVIHVMRQLRPASILDVGVGFGKWGHLFREYTDILESENDPRRYRRRHWQIQIDGIEGHEAYLTPMHRFLYNRIHLGRAEEVLPRLPRYDLIFLGDIIEHFDKAAGLKLLRAALRRANKSVVVSTPRFETEQTDLCGNELERHRSVWAASDFQQFPGAIVKTVDRDTLLAVLPKPGVTAPEVGPPRQPPPAAAREWREARAELTRLIPVDEAFILVDEEQLRAGLPHHRVFPFLEKRGQYWGPPADDATAIRECDRLRRHGARRIAFIRSTFWWLEHYQEFARRLRASGRVVQGTRRTLIFDLPGPLHPRRAKTATPK